MITNYYFRTAPTLSGFKRNINFKERYFLIVVLSFLLMINNVYSQQNYSPQVSIPKTPTVAAMEKFIENPVSLHTGIQDITIPVYEIQLKGINIPISLKYHSSGIQVDELASEVGLGWSLDAAGAVSSTVHGLPDSQGDWPPLFGEYAKFNPLTLTNHYDAFDVSETAYLTAGCAEPFSLYDIYQSTTDIAYVRGVVMGLRDSEPDVYFFNMPGKSGKFYIDATGNFQTIPYQKVKIERIDSASILRGYKITDENGNLFVFKKKATSLTTAIPSPCYTNSLTGECPYYVPSTNEYNHFTFHLTQVITTSGDTATYSYTSYRYGMVNQKSFSRKQRTFGDIFECREYINPDSDPVCQGESSSSTSFYTYRLDKIQTNRGHRVVFNYNPVKRQDSAGYELQSIGIFQKNQSTYDNVKTFSLKHSYFQTTSNASATARLNFRLRLDSAGDNGKPFYFFDYNSTQLPHRLSFSQDHWGFYNGQTNTNLLPKEPQYGFITGANRETDFEYTKAAVLTKLTYPTGGTLEYEYEPNSYYSSGGEFIYTPASQGLTSVANSTVTASFTITSNSIQQHIQWHNTDLGDVAHNDNCYITIYSVANSYSRSFYNDHTAYGIKPEGDWVNLAPGTYTIKIETIGSTYEGWLAINFLETSTMSAGNRTIGGLRIKKTKNCAEGASGCLETLYKYVKSDTTKSSGIIFQMPLYTHSRATDYRYLAISGCAVSSVSCNPILQSSTSITPLMNSQGTHVVYDQVDVYNKNKTIGKKTYKFLVDKSLNPGITGPPFPMTITYDWLNGLPVETTTFAYTGSEFKPVKRTRNYYLYDHIGARATDLPNEATIRGIKMNLFNYPSGTRIQCGLVVWYRMSPVDIEFVPYTLISSWHYLTKTTEIDYNLNGTDSLTSSTEYFYDNPTHIQLTRTRKYDSKGKQIVTQQTYPLDFPSTTNTVLQHLNTKHQVANLLEQKTFQIAASDTTLIASQLLIHKLVNGTVQLDSVLQAKLATPLAKSSFTSYNGSVKDSRYDKQVVIQSYDANNNPVQYADRNGIKNAFIWDKAYNTPIAHVVNASFSKVAYSSFETDELGNWSILSGSQITGASFSGRKHIYFSTGSLGSGTLSSSERYLLTFWAKSGNTFSVTGFTAQTGETINGWTYYSYTIQGVTSVTVNGTGYMDEARLCPVNSQMTSYTLQPGVGILSVTNPNNITSYYEYDALNRLKNIKDQYGNVLKNYRYHYKDTNPTSTYE